ncbi:hypothetical protein, partial [Oenococcus oeni]|uniref:hypothetical protein n=1 Tax=Oenococcus oeni TaxID=1247 RepID=UPI001646EFDA
MKHKFYSNILYSDKKTAMNKAKQDVGTILDAMGYQPINFDFDSKSIKPIKWFRYLIQAFNAIHIVPRDGTFLLQYPTYFGTWFECILLDFFRRKNVKTIVLIHDVIQLRDQQLLDTKHYKKVLNVFNRADFIISHSPKMTGILRRVGVHTPIFNLVLFDYLTESISQTQYSNRVINFAGNLDKSPFILKLSKNPKIQLNVFGNQPSFDLPKEIKYCGAFDPELLTGEFHSGFGLVWDGPEIDVMSGIGLYQKFNIPHKVSMYLAAGIPVIIWSEAAVAQVIKKHGVGIVVDSLK